MIISASRRTDLPCYFFDWFLQRLKEGVIYTRNPMNYRMVSEIKLTPDVVDIIVFWTKNPWKLLKQLDALKEYSYYFQFTLNGYGPSLEKNVPTTEEMIPVFKSLSNKIGKERVIWRYDPIVINHQFSLEFHSKNFEWIANHLKDDTNQVVISFFDMYKKISKKMQKMGIDTIEDTMVIELAKRLSEIAHKNQLKIVSCAEKYDLKKYGIEHGSCIDLKLIEEILGSKLKITKDKNQRLECGCVQSIDIGEYNTCLNGCQYCYANTSEKAILNKYSNYVVGSPILCGKIEQEDQIKVRQVASNRVLDGWLWDI